MALSWSIIVTCRSSDCYFYAAGTLFPSDLSAPCIMHI